MRFKSRSLRALQLLKCRCAFNRTHEEKQGAGSMESMNVCIQLKTERSSTLDSLCSHTERQKRYARWTFSRWQQAPRGLALDLKRLYCEVIGYKNLQTVHAMPLREDPTYHVREAAHAHRKTTLKKTGSILNHKTLCGGIWPDSAT